MYFKCLDFIFYFLLCEFHQFHYIYFFDFVSLKRKVEINSSSQKNIWPSFFKTWVFYFPLLILQFKEILCVFEKVNLNLFYFHFLKLYEITLISSLNDNLICLIFSEYIKFFGLKSFFFIFFVLLCCDSISHHSYFNLFEFR